MSVNQPRVLEGGQQLEEGGFDDSDDRNDEELDVCGGDDAGGGEGRDVTKPQPPPIGFSIAQIMGFIQKNKTETAEATEVRPGDVTAGAGAEGPQKSDDDEESDRTEEEADLASSPHLWRPQPCR